MTSNSSDGCDGWNEWQRHVLKVLDVIPGLQKSVEVTLAKHDGRITTLEKVANGQAERDKVISDLRVDIGKLQMQIKVTWALLSMVITGLVGVAFSIWQVP